MCQWQLNGSSTVAGWVKAQQLQDGSIDVAGNLTPETYTAAADAAGVVHRAVLSCTNEASHKSSRVY